MRGCNRETVATTVRSMVPAPAGDGGKGPRADAVDLVLTVYPRALDEAAVTSLFPQALTLAADLPELLGEVKANLAAARQAHPGDVTAEVAAALVDIAAGDARTVPEVAARLEARVAELPLETIADGARPNTRQRAEAARRLALWLVARACWKQADAREAGDRVAALALEAASRQLDASWRLAMLREWGEEAGRRGDAKTAEARWAAMLDLVLAIRTAPPAAAPPVRPRAPSTRPARAAGPAEDTAVATRERYEQAIEIARLAARHGHGDLSLRAVREALGGGPPMVALGPSAVRAVALRGLASETPAAPDQAVAGQIAELVAFWQRGDVPAVSIYETLRDVVLPAGRPREVFLFPAPLARFDKNPESVRPIPPEPQSVGALVAHWAVAAGRSDDLRSRLAERRIQPASELAAGVLRALLAQARARPAAVEEELAAIGLKLQQQPLPADAELACHAALPALAAARAETPRAAVTIIERAALAGGSDEEPVDSLLLTLARFDLEHTSIAAGRKRIDQALTAAERGTGRSPSDDPAFRRKRAYLAAAAEYLLRAGQWDDALDLLGQNADAPPARGGDPSAAGALALLARPAADRPAAERLRAAESLVAAGAATEIGTTSRRLPARSNAR